MLSLITKFQRRGSHLLSRMSSLGLEPVPTCQGGDPLPSPPGQALKETRYASVIVFTADVGKGFQCPQMGGISVIWLGNSNPQKVTIRKLRYGRSYFTDKENETQESSRIFPVSHNVEKRWNLDMDFFFTSSHYSGRSHAEPGPGKGNESPELLAEKRCDLTHLALWRDEKAVLLAEASALAQPAFLLASFNSQLTDFEMLSKKQLYLKQPFCKAIWH